jgi:Rrf2 family protein
MRLSTRMRYGCRAMTELAAAYPGRAVSVRDMARNQRLSAKYLEHIVGSLRTAGLIEAVRGIHGGYALCRPPEHISLSEVFRVLEGSPAPVDCVDNPDACPIMKGCPTRDTWVEITEAIKGVLEGTTLRDLADRRESKTDSSTLMYHI